MEEEAEKEEAKLGGRKVQAAEKVQGVERVNRLGGVFERTTDEASG
jgi:hypothetical protein